VKRLSLGRSMIVTIGGNAVSSMFWLASGLLAARLLGPSGRGELAAIQTWGMALSILAMLGMPQALVYFAAREPEQSASHTTSAMIIALLGCVPVLVIGYLAMPWLLSAQRPAVASTARLYLLIGIVSAIAQVPLNALLGRRDFFAWNGLRILSSVCWLLPLLLAWGCDRRSAEFVADMNMIFFATIFTTGVWVTIKTRIPGTYRPKLSSWKPMLAFGLPTVISTVPQNLNLRLDQMLMAGIFAPRLLGLYVTAVAWSSIVNPLFQAISVVIFPHVAAHVTREAQVSSLTRILRLGIPMAILVAGGVAFITPFGISFLFGHRFDESRAAGVVLVFAGAILGINSMLEDGLRGLGAPKATMWSEFGGLIVTVLLLALLLKPLGIMGAAIASLVGYATVAIQLVSWTRQLTGCTFSALLFPRGSELLEVYDRAWLSLRSAGKATAD
jgi:O-antigen/teichoic acid export membrane protein